MAKGQKTGGRVAGVPNKYNASIKEMIVGALSDVGGRKYLAERAIDQPVAFMGLIGRVLPLQVTGENGGRCDAEAKRARPRPAHDRSRRGHDRIVRNQRWHNVKHSCCRSRRVIGNDLS
jgi:hypothetical protein